MQGAATLQQEQVPLQKRQLEVARIFRVGHKSDERALSGINKDAELELKTSSPLNNNDYIVLYLEGTVQEQLAAKDRLRELEQQLKLKLPAGMTLQVT